MGSSISDYTENNQVFIITKTITPDWFSSWENKSRHEKIGKIFIELGKTLACLTLIIPLCFIATDLIRSKIHKTNLNLVAQNENPPTFPQNKAKKIALLIFAVTVIATSVFFCCYYYPILIQSYPTLVASAQDFIIKYYPSAVGGVIATWSGYSFNKYYLKA